MGRGAELIVGLDVGTSKVAAVIGQCTPEGLVVRGAGYAPSQGAVDRGVVTDLDAAAQAIRQAIHEAELRADVQVHSTLVTVGGDHIRGLESHGVVSTTRGEVSEADVNRVLRAASAVPLPEDYQVLQVLLRDFVVDDQEGVRSPVEMKGHRLEARVHVLAGRTAAIENLTRAVLRAEIRPLRVLWSGWAAAEAVLSEEEKELGVALLDLGAGTTNVLCYHRGALRFAAALRIGGKHVTQDIAAGLETSPTSAERLKIEWGTALASLVGDEETIEVPSLAQRPPRRVLRRELSRVIQARVEEIIELAWREVRRAGLLPQIRAGVVLTGGGALLPGIVEVVRKETTQSQIRIGDVALGVAEVEADGEGIVSDTAYTAALGLLREAAAQRVQGSGEMSSGFVGRSVRWLKSYLGALFE